MKTYASANPAKYKVGMWAFVLHRLTGLGIAAYLVAHLIVISTAAVFGTLSFDRIMETLHKPWVIVLEIVLIGAVLYHLLNGLRLLLFDVGVGVRSQKPIFWSFMGVGALAMVFAVVALWPLIAG